jgi:hypothetical protein
MNFYSAMTSGAPNRGCSCRNCPAGWACVISLFGLLLATGTPARAQSAGVEDRCVGKNLIWKDGRCLVTGIPDYGVAPLARKQIESIAKGRGSPQATPPGATPQAEATPDVSGRWRVSYETGSFDLELRQKGSEVEGGTSLRGILSGNILTGTFSDLIGSGPLRLTFSLDGNSFEGTSEVRSQISHFKGVRLGASGTALETPQSILRARARLDAIQASKAPPEEQAKKACRNLFAETYKPAAGSPGTDISWTTSFKSGSSLRVGPFFPRQNGLSYLQVRSVGNTETFSIPLTEANRANGIEYKGSVTFRGTIFRTGSDDNGWTEWKDIPSGDPARRNFARCFYEIKGGVVEITAIDDLVGLNFSQLSRPAAIPPG